MPVHHRQLPARRSPHPLPARLGLTDRRSTSPTPLTAPRPPPTVRATPPPPTAPPRHAPHRRPPAPSTRQPPKPPSRPITPRAAPDEPAPPPPVTPSLVRQPPIDHLPTRPPPPPPHPHHPTSRPPPALLSPSPHPLPVRFPGGLRVLSTDSATFFPPHGGDSGVVQILSTGEAVRTRSWLVRWLGISGKPLSTACGELFVHRSRGRLVHRVRSAAHREGVVVHSFSTGLSTVRQQNTRSHRAE